MNHASWHPCRLHWLLLVLCLALTQKASAQSRHVYNDVAIRAVINDIQSTSAYRFLYRDALISGKTISFEASSDELLDAFDIALQAQALDLQIDEERHQILLTKSAAPTVPQQTVIQGHILDNESGARLPFATVSWEEGSRLSGVASNGAGAFHITLSALRKDQQHLDLTASYVGYAPKNIRIDLTDTPTELPIRLTRLATYTQEVVVSSSVLHTDLDTSWHHLINPSAVSTLGESNVLRSLQMLPSVSVSTALSSGLNVRGSSADGFQVLLDGIPIYNQQHFFGMFDVFNKDALQSVGLYYSIAPAGFQGPPGGTLSFVTRTGSQTLPKASVGVSNTSFKATAEGPLANGRGSWLISGRHSYLDAVDWFNNPTLIDLALNIDRETEEVSTGAPINQRGYIPGTSSASFYDVHGKVYFESENGHRLTINGYLGGDRAMHDAVLLSFEAPEATGEPGTPPQPSVIDRTDVATNNRWGNEATSLHYQRALTNTIYSHTLLAYSRYSSDFSKDDFPYKRLSWPRNDNGPPDQGGPNNPPRNDPNNPRGNQNSPDPNRNVRGNDQTRFAPFAHTNTLLELKLSQHLDLAPPHPGTWALGYELHHYDGRYDESSLLQTITRNNDFSDTEQSTQFDLFGQYELQSSQTVHLQTGLRSHYYSSGDYFRLSPRFYMRLFPQDIVSFSVGFSRNYQFLHRLSLEDVSSPDVWVLTNEREAPGSVNHFTTGIYINPMPSLSVQVEGYFKEYDNLRQHETRVSARQTAQEGILQAPWLTDTEARAKGLEVMARQRLGPVVWSNSYTLSRMEIQHRSINNGEYFRADWDRTHQFTSNLQVNVAKDFAVYLTWMYASGNPNSLASLDDNEPAYLDNYHRLDATLQYTKTVGGITLEAQGSLFNLYDRDNPWYRTSIPVLVQRGTPGRNNTTRPSITETVENVYVYDLGLQPSFDLTLRF